MTTIKPGNPAQPVISESERLAIRKLLAAFAEVTDNPMLFAKNEVVEVQPLDAPRSKIKNLTEVEYVL